MSVSDGVPHKGRAPSVALVAMFTTAFVLLFLAQVGALVPFFSWSVLPIELLLDLCILGATVFLLGNVRVRGPRTLRLGLHNLARALGVWLVLLLYCYIVAVYCVGWSIGWHVVSFWHFVAAGGAAVVLHLFVLVCKPDP